MKKKKVIFIIIAILAIVIIAGALFVSSMQKNLDQLADIQIQNIDLTKIKDGTYEGAHEAFPVVVEVKVTVENHKITEIELVKHTNGQGKAAEAIIEEVISAQSLQLDVVSGATYSSKVILKAIENALIK
jgi:uncharacterized protein with FMN-binding domain